MSLWRAWWWSQNSGGGGGGLTKVEDDPNPALGGDLDVNSNEIRFTEVLPGVDYVGLKAPSILNYTTAFEIVPVQVFLTSGTHAATPTQDHLIVNAAAGNVVINLHTASNERFRPLLITRTDSSFPTNTVTVNATGGDTVKGVASITIDNQWDTRQFINDESVSWYVI